MEDGGQPAGSSKGKRLRLLVAMVAALGGAGVLYWGYARRFPTVRPQGPKMAWYYDLDNDDLFAATAGALPSATSPQGASGVRAHVFACGACGDTDADKQWIGYLERVPYPMAQRWRALQPPSGGPPPDPATAMQAAKELFDITQATEVASPAAPDDWVNYMSDDAQAIRTAAAENCPANDLQECFPTSP